VIGPRLCVGRIPAAMHGWRGSGDVVRSGYGRSASQHPPCTTDGLAGTPPPCGVTLSASPRARINYRSRFQRVLWHRPGLQFPRPHIVPIFMFVPIFLVKVTAWVYLGCGSCPQLTEANLRLFSTGQPGGRVLRPRRPGSSSACSRPAPMRARISSPSRRVTHQRGSHQDGHRTGAPHRPPSADRSGTKGPARPQLRFLR
jgi:hypothetical protein